MRTQDHQLEHNAAERDYFAGIGSNGQAAYRRAAEACTGAVPTWAKRKPGGRPKKPRLAMAGVPLRLSADTFRAEASGDTCR